MQNNIETTLQAIDNQIKDDDIVTLEEIKKFLEKDNLTENEKNIARKAKDAINSLENKIQIGLDNLNQKLVLNVFLNKFNEVLIEREWWVEWNYAKRSWWEKHISFWKYQFTGDYIKYYLIEVWAPENIKKIDPKTSNLDDQNILIKYLSEIWWTDKWIKAQKIVYFKETIIKWIKIALDNWVTNLSSIAHIIDSKHNWWLNYLLKNSTDLNNPLNVWDTRKKYYEWLSSWYNKFKKWWESRVDNNTSEFKYFSWFNLKKQALLWVSYEKMLWWDISINSVVDKKVIANVNEKLWIEERFQSVWWIWQLSIVDVLWFAYWGLNIFWALMDWFSWNWGDAMQKALIAYVWIKNMTREIWWNLDDWKDKIEKISEKYEKKWADKNRLKLALEKIYNWEWWDLKESLINNLFIEDKDKRVEYLEKIRWVFENKINWNKLNNFNWDISKNNLWEIIDREEFNNLNSNMQWRIIELINISKKLWINNFHEFNWVVEYTTWNYAPNRFDKVRNLMA